VLIQRVRQDSIEAKSPTDPEPQGTGVDDDTSVMLGWPSNNELGSSNVRKFEMRAFPPRR
jgi:hypothetical protein